MEALATDTPLVASAAQREPDRLERIEKKVDNLMTAVAVLVDRQANVKDLQETNNDQEKRIVVLETNQTVYNVKVKLAVALAGVAGAIAGGVSTSMLTKYLGG